MVEAFKEWRIARGRTNQQEHNIRRRKKKQSIWIKVKLTVTSPFWSPGSLPHHSLNFLKSVDSENNTSYQWNAVNPGMKLEKCVLKSVLLEFVKNKWHLSFNCCKFNIWDFICLSTFFHHDIKNFNTHNYILN